MWEKAQHLEEEFQKRPDLITALNNKQWTEKFQSIDKNIGKVINPKRSDQQNTQEIIDRQNAELTQLKQSLEVLQNQVTARGVDPDQVKTQFEEHRKYKK